MNASSHEACKVKVCGITRVIDAMACVEAGVDAIGLNFVPSSPRRISVQVARILRDTIVAHGAAGGAPRRCIVVGIVADMTIDAMVALTQDAGLDCLQLCGSESPATVAALLPHAYKAVRIGSALDVVHAQTFPGEYILVDAKVGTALGGTGHTFDWALVGGLARIKHLTLAGGLNPTNVAGAVQSIRPYCVDVASGVEVSGNPRAKDARAIAAFVQAAKNA